jgi:signal transduction histidine kinase
MDSGPESPLDAELSRLRALNADLEHQLAQARQSEATLQESGRALARTGAELSSTLDFAQAADRVVATLRRLIGCRRVHLYRFERETETLVGVAAVGEGQGMSLVGRHFPASSGISGRAIRENRAVWVPDIFAEPRIELDPKVRDVIQVDGFQSFAAVPLRARGELVGSLVLVDTTGRVFAEAELSLLSAFGDQAALALDNARLFTEAERRRRAAEGLAEIGRTLSETLDPHKVASQVGNSLRALLHTRSAVVYLIDPETRRLVRRMVAQDPTTVTHWPESLESGTGLTGLALSRGESIAVPDSLADPRITYEPTVRALISQSPARALLAVVLRAATRPLGVLVVSDTTGRHYSREEIELVEAFARQAALALENSRIHDEVTLHGREAEVLAGLTGTISAALDLGTVLQRVTEAAQELCQSDLARIALLDPAQDAMVFRHSIGARFGRYDTIRIQRGRGMGGAVWAMDRPLRTENRYTDSAISKDYIALVEEEGIVTSLVVPIRAGGRVEGLIYVDNRTPRPFSERDEAMLVRLADHAAIAINNARLFTAEQAARAEAEATTRALRETGEQLRQAQKMEAIGRLAGGVAHDFNNLLTVISGRSELLLTRAPGDERLRRDLDLIYKTAERAGTLTRQLLSISRKQMLQPKVLDLDAVVSGLEPMLRRVIGEDVELVVRPAPAVGWVHADPGQVEQILLNLIVNSRDAMPQGGRLTIETCDLAVPGPDAPAGDAVPPGRYVLLSVRDTGVGMDAGVQAHLFEPFFTTKEVGKGTGLGLATVYGIVSQSGGHIRFESAPGQGTLFRIYFPEVEPPRAPGVREPLSGVRRGSETVLVVEDEAEVRALARDILEMSGYSVLEAGGPHEALELVERRREPIHLVLTDVVMPGMSGRALAGRLAAVAPEIRVMYMSGYTDDTLGRHGMLDSGTAFLEKPFTPQALSRKVRETLDAPRDGTRA